jgi:hypothetical protein
MSAKIRLDEISNVSGVPVAGIDRTYPSIFSGFMTHDEWSEACDSIDKVMKEATKFSRTNMRLNFLFKLGAFATLILGGVIGAFVGLALGNHGVTEDPPLTAAIGAAFGSFLGGPFVYYIVLVVLRDCCGICMRGNKGLIDVCRHLVMAVEDVSKLNPNVKFTLMQDLPNGAAKVITNTDEIFDFKTVWIQAIVDGSNSMVADDAKHQQDKYQKLDNRRNVLNQALNDISNRHDLDEIQKAKLREKFIEDFV